MPESLHTRCNFLRILKARQPDELECRRQREKGNRQPQIWLFDGIDAARALVHARAKEEQSADQRRDHIAKRAEALREIQARRRRLLRTQVEIYGFAAICINVTPDPRISNAPRNSQ